jgi:hypothetical protein
VSDAYSHHRFDRTVDKDGITGFRTDSILTCPVKDDEGKVIAVGRRCALTPPDP